MIYRSCSHWNLGKKTNILRFFKAETSIMQVYIFFLHVVFCIYHFYTHSLSVISHLPAALGDSDCWESICSKFLLKIAKQHITHIIMQYLPILQLFMHIYTLYFYSEDTLLTYLQLVSSGFSFLKRQHVSENKAAFQAEHRLFQLSHAPSW